MKLDIWKKKNDKNTPQTLADFFRGRELGAPISWGPLSMIPVFGSACEPKYFAPPEQALELTQVTHYGRMILRNKALRPTIVPLHLGYFQKAAQNHAMCTSWILQEGQEREFTDACCIQAAQGGYITSVDSRFIILPHPLRAKAFALRGQESYSKLWNDIAAFNKTIGLKNRGHLDELKQAHQPEMLRTVFQLEQHPEQSGAIFLCDDQIVGIELAPDAAFWNDLHVPLVMYCYAPLRLQAEFEGKTTTQTHAISLDGLADLEDLRRRLAGVHEARKTDAFAKFSALCELPISLTHQMTHKQQSLSSVQADSFVGQAATLQQQPAYLSLSHSQLHT